MEVTQLTEEQFDEKFTLVTNKFDDNASFNGCLHETFGAELEYVREMASLNRVITIIEGESEESDDEEFDKMGHGPPGHPPMLGVGGRV